MKKYKIKPVTVTKNTIKQATTNSEEVSYLIQKQYDNRNSVCEHQKVFKNINRDSELQSKATAILYGLQSRLNATVETMYNEITGETIYIIQYKPISFATRIPMYDRVMEKTFTKDITNKIIEQSFASLKSFLDKGENQ